MSSTHLPVARPKEFDPSVVPTAAELEAVRDGAFSLARAALFANISERYLRDLMDAGEIEWFWFGRERRVPRASLTNYLAKLYASSNRGEPSC